MVEVVSSHTKELVGVHASAIEVRINGIGERQTGEQGPKSSAMLETEVFSPGGSAHGAKRPDTSTEGSSLSNSTCFKCVATRASHNLIAEISSLSGHTRFSKWVMIHC
jgi:hypothetical protein